MSFLTGITYMGIVVFALTGALKAGTYKMDVFGGLVVAFVTAYGIEVAMRHGLNDVYALLMGVITATFGGLIADLFCNAVPNLFKKGELYATACALGGLFYILLKHAGLNTNINLAICVLFVLTLRIYSKRKRLTLPEI
jgi:uncharacterized membrane protein YeiH